MPTDQQQSQSSSSSSSVPIVFVHGFKGAYLKNTKTGSTEWITALQGMGLSKMKYDLPITWQDPDTQDRDDIIPGDPISFVGGVIDIYGTLVNWGKKQAANTSTSTGRPFHCYTWDWRRSPFEAVDGLRRFLEGIGRPCQLLCHSMGALIGYVTVQRAYAEGGAALANRLVHSMLCVGPPFKPMDVFLGSTVPECKAYSSRMTARTAFSLTSTYALIPIYGCDNEYGDPEFWVRHRAGGYLTSTGGKLTDQEMAHFVACINLTKRFQELMMTPLPQGHPPIAVLAGNKIETSTKIDITNPDWKHPGTSLGDGTVPFESALGVPEGVEIVAVETSSKDHVGLTRETAKIEALLKKLLEYKQTDGTGTDRETP